MASATRKARTVPVGTECATTRGFSLSLSIFYSITLFITFNGSILLVGHNLCKRRTLSDTIEGDTPHSYTCARSQYLPNGLPQLLYCHLWNEAILIVFFAFIWTQITHRNLSMTQWCKLIAK